MLLELIEEKLNEIKLSRIPLDLETKDFLKVIKSEFQRRATTPEIAHTCKDSDVAKYLEILKQSNLEILAKNTVAKLELENKIADELLANYKPNFPKESDILEVYTTSEIKGLKAIKFVADGLLAKGFEVDMKALKATIEKL